MQHLIIIIVVALAAAYLGRRFYRSFKAAGSEQSCACGCSSCGSADTDDPVDGAGGGPG